MLQSRTKDLLRPVQTSSHSGDTISVVRREPSRAKAAEGACRLIAAG
jgi:hypothetical protein